MNVPFVQKAITNMVKGRSYKITTTSGTLKGKLRGIEGTRCIFVTIRGKTFSVTKESIKFVTTSKKVHCEQ